MILDSEEQKKIILSLLEGSNMSSKPENIKAMYNFVISVENAVIKKEEKEDGKKILSDR